MTTYVLINVLMSLAGDITRAYRSRDNERLKEAIKAHKAYEELCKQPDSEFTDSFDLTNYKL